MKPTYYYLLMAALLSCCAPLAKVENDQINIPSIGAIGKENGSFISKNFEERGFPQLKNSVSLLATEVPYTKASYKEYRQLKSQRGEKTTVNFADSLQIKPKYLRLQIQDKIGLTTQLNQPENGTVRTYLEKDAACKIVSEIAIQTDPILVDQLVRAEQVYLSSNKRGELQVEFWYGTVKERFALPTKDIFSYRLMGFCWGEDVYGNARIDTLNDHGNCPDGTEKNAKKLNDTKSYLKL